MWCDNSSLFMYVVGCTKGYLMNLDCHKEGFCMNVVDIQ